MKPKPAIATPQMQAAIVTPSPWRRTWVIHPDASEPRSAPAAGAAYSRPSSDAPPPSRWSAIAGNSAVGMPNTMALVSTAKIPISTCRPFRNRKPSTIARTLGRSAASSGGKLGSARIAISDAAYVTRSMPYVQGTPATAIRTPPTAGPPTAASEP